MKKNGIFSVGILVLVSIAFILSAAKAEVIVYEGFDYPASDSLEGLGHPNFSWATNDWIKNPSASDWIVVSNSLIHPSIPTTGGHVAQTNYSYGANYERKFKTCVLEDGQAIWFSFLVQITKGASWNLLFTSSGLDASRLGVRGSHLDHSIVATIGYNYSGGEDLMDLGQNTTRLIVGRYRYSASSLEQLDVWMDPDMASEPQSGGSSSSNHIVHTRQLDVEPDRIDSVLLEDRSIGALAFDELRVGTTWTDVISRSLDRVVIDRIVANGTGVKLDLSRLTPGALTKVQRSQLVSPAIWQDVDAFLPPERSITRELPLTGGIKYFYRIETR